MDTNLNRKLIYLVIILLTLISQRIYYNTVFYPSRDLKIQETKLILKGEMEAPYQYRILKPVIFSVFDKILSPVIKNETTRFEIIVKGMLIFWFLLIYFLFFKFLKYFYSDIISLFGLALLGIVLPLSVTDNMWEEGDAIMLLLYLVTFHLMFKNKDVWIPLVIAFGTFNREQTVFILVFYAAYLIEQKKLFKLKSILIMVSSILLYLVIYFGIRQYFGDRFNHYTPMVLGINISSLSILRLWVEQVFIFIIFSIIAYKRSRLFFKLALLALIPYTALYFFYGVLGELGKFLPAYLIMITVSLQLFVTDNPKLRAAQEPE